MGAFPLRAIMAAQACLALCQCQTPAPAPPEPPVFVPGQPLPVSRQPALAARGLIHVHEVDPTLLVSLRYKTGANLTGKPLYPENFPALLRPNTAVRLAHANRLVAKDGFRIVLWDAYRPPSVQERLFEASQHNDTFVANPRNAPSQHSCGTAVDVTLVHLDGRPAKMPTEFDAFTPEAASGYVHPDPEVRHNLQVLQQAMARAGFWPLPAEWWHFIDHDYKRFPDTIALDAGGTGF